jgi:hypothetical protein
MGIFFQQAKTGPPSSPSVKWKGEGGGKIKFFRVFSVDKRGDIS